MKRFFAAGAFVLWCGAALFAQQTPQVAPSVQEMDALIERIESMSDGEFFEFLRGMATEGESEWWQKPSQPPGAAEKPVLVRELLERAAGFLQTGDYLMAIVVTTHIITADPDNALAYALRGEAYLAQNANRYTAYDNYTTALKLDPSLTWVEERIKEIALFGMGAE